MCLQSPCPWTPSTASVIGEGDAAGGEDGTVQHFSNSILATVLIRSYLHVDCCSLCLNTVDLIQLSQIIQIKCIQSLFAYIRSI